MAEETKNTEANVAVYSNRKTLNETVPLFLNDGHKLEVEEESCCSAHSTLVSDQNTAFTAVKLHSKIMTLKGTKIETWPSTTEVACWYDTYPFTTVPVPLPHHYDQQKKAFLIYGNLCSVECALAYMHRESRRHDLWERVVLFEDMMRKVFNVKTVGCEPAPPFLTLSRFGGFYSIEEYRNSFTTVKMTVIAPPFLMFPLVIQEKHHNAVHANETVHDKTALSTGHVLRGLRRPQRQTAESAPSSTEAAEATTEAATIVHQPVQVASGPLRVPALDDNSDSSDGSDPVVTTTFGSTSTAVPVPPLSSAQLDTEYYTRLSKTTKGKGRGRGRGSIVSRSAGLASASASNTMLSSFLINK